MPQAFAPQTNNATTPTTVANQKTAAVSAFYEVTIEPENLALAQNQQPVHYSIRNGGSSRYQIKAAHLISN